MEMTTTSLTATAYEQGQGARIEELRATEISFIPNVAFEFASAEPEADFVQAVIGYRVQGEAAPAGLPPHLQRLCEAELLSFEHEQALFRAMNYRKFQAEQLRTRLDQDHTCSETLESLECVLGEVRAIRDHLVKANMRLVISIVKKFVTPQLSFDEMLSDGLVTLMVAVDKFDFDRGFRFSTYAYRSIARTAYRAGRSVQQLGPQLASEDWSAELADDRGSSAMRDGFWSGLRNLTGAMIEQLDRREKFIIRCRYALGSHRKVKTLQFLADKLGVSKERVRQLEIRAVKKLQSMATEIELDDQFGSAVM